MTDKIIVEFSRKELKKMCPITDVLCVLTCKKRDEDLLRCHIEKVDFKIKEQKNERKNSDNRFTSNR